MKSKEKLIKQYLEDCYGDFVDDYDTSDVEEHFSYGLEIAEKEKNKQIKDKINALKSKLAEEKRQKLTKIINQERVKELEAQIKILQSLL